MTEAVMGLSQPHARVQHAMDDLDNLGPFASIEQLQTLERAQGGRPDILESRSFLAGMIVGRLASRFGADHEDDQV